MATQAYTKNQDIPLGKEIYLTTGHTRIQVRTHRERTLVSSRRQKWTSRIRTSGVPGGGHRQDRKEEEENDAFEKVQENSTEETRIGGWIGQEGERWKIYSVTVIDDIKRNSRNFAGDSLVRKKDSRLSKGGCRSFLPGARI